MERRRALGSVVAEMGKEWKILLDKTVEDNSITQYLINAQGCTEFYVSIFLRMMQTLRISVTDALVLTQKTHGVALKIE